MNTEKCVVCEELTVVIFKRKEHCGDINYFCDNCDIDDFVCGQTNACRECELTETPAKVL